MERGSATLPINLVSPASTTSPLEDSQPRLLPISGEDPGAATGAEPVSVAHLQIPSPTVVHELPLVYCGGRIPTITPPAEPCRGYLPSFITPPGGLHPERKRQAVPDSAIAWWEVGEGGAFFQWGGA